MEECKHGKFIAYTAHPRIRAYQCEDCKKVAFGNLPIYYSLEDLFAVISRIKANEEREFESIKPGKTFEPSPDKLSMSDKVRLMEMAERSCRDVFGKARRDEILIIYNNLLSGITTQ